MREQEGWIIYKDYESFLGIDFLIEDRKGCPIYADFNSWKVMTAQRTPRQFGMSVLLRLLLVLGTLPMLLSVFFLLPLVHVCRTV